MKNDPECNSSKILVGVDLPESLRRRVEAAGKTPEGIGKIIQCAVEKKYPEIKKSVAQKHNASKLIPFPGVILDGGCLQAAV